MKLNFVFVKTNDEEVGRPVSDYFGVTGDGPQVTLIQHYNGHNKIFWKNWLLIVDLIPVGYWIHRRR